MAEAFAPIKWFDWDAVARYYGTNLPHYEMPGAIYFVTFRLWDSLPAGVYRRLADVRDAFLQDNPFPHSPKEEQRFRHIYLLPLERYLDQGLGECVLRNPKVRKVVQETLLHFDGERYQVGDFVVMPNHVHLLARTRCDLSLRVICHQWKNLSAARINRLLSRRGRLWQSEPFDHIVRSPSKLEQCRRYIANNPCHLQPGDFLLSEGTLFRPQPS